MKITTKLLNLVKAFILPIVFWILFTVITKGTFGTWTLFLAIIRTSIVPLLVAMSLSFGMLMGLWNFAAGSVVYASAIFGAYIGTKLGLNIWFTSLFCILIGVLLNAVMGGLYRVLRIPCLVLSLGLVMVYESLPGLFVPNATSKIPLSANFLGRSPWCYLVLLVMFAIFYYINNFTVLGANMSAIGSDAKIAFNSGINIDRVKFISFLIAGLFLGVAGVIYLSINVTVMGTIGLGSVTIIFDGIMGIFIAFVLIRYINYAVAVTVGTLTMRILASGLMALGLSSEVRSTLTGAFLFLVVVYSANSDFFRRMKARKQVAEKADADFLQAESAKG